MELGVEDRDLTMRCCRLLMVLTRNLNFDARTFSTLEVKRLKGKETKEEGMIRFTRETASKANAQQQISAFLSFKEAVCTGDRSHSNSIFHHFRFYQLLLYEHLLQLCERMLFCVNHSYQENLKARLDY